MYPRIGMPQWGIFVHQQVKSLIKSGYKVTVISPTPKSNWLLSIFSAKWKTFYQMPLYDNYEGVSVYYPRYYAIPKGWLKFLWGYFAFWDAIKVIKTNKIEFDVIHAHAPIPSGTTGVLLKKHFKKPLVTTIHGSMVTNFPFKNKRSFKAVENVLIKSDCIVAVSNYLKGFIETHFVINSDVQVIGNGVDRNSFLKYPQLVDKPYWMKGRKICLTVANFIPQKGYESIVRSIPSVIEKIPDILFVFIGDGGGKVKIEQLISQLNVENYVRLLGRLNHTDVLKYMRLCDIFLLPSIKEGFGIVYIEAMLFKKPVISCAGSGPDDIVDSEKNGILIESQSSTLITKAIIDLFDHPEKISEYGKNGHKKVLQNYLWENNIKKMAAVYSLLN